MQHILRAVLFWVITWRVVVISYRRFGTTYRSDLQESTIQKVSRLKPSLMEFIQGRVRAVVVLIAWCQPIGVMQEVGREVECGN
jgi:hypothetical protein